MTGWKPIPRVPVNRRVGVPTSYAEHARLMFDLQVLALQGDITRVITFQLARETSNRTYPEIGVSEPHHPLTHHGNNPEKIAKVAKINQFHVSLFAGFLEKLHATPEGNGSLLDHSLYLYGSGMGNPNVHDHTNLPILVAGQTPLKSGFTPFFFAVREGRTDVVLRLVAAGINVNQRMRPEKPMGKGPRRGTSPLLLAVENGHFELATALLEAGADPKDSRGGVTALHAITRVRKPIRGDGDPPPIGSGSMDSLEFVRRLVASGADVNARHGERPKDRRGRLNKSDATPFLLAAETGDVSLMKLLVELGADPTLVNSENCTPLLAAAGVGILGDGDESAGTEAEAMAAVRYLLKLGADINAVDDNGESAMHGAAYKSWTRLVKVLSENGADVRVWNRKNRRGWTPLMIAQGHRPGNFRPSAETIVAVEAAMRAAGIEPLQQSSRTTSNHLDK